MDDDNELLIAAFTDLKEKVKAGKIHSIFCLAIGEDGPLPVVLVQPAYRESIIIALNEELTGMLGTPHHIVETAKLERFCKRFGISDLEVLQFREEEQGR